MTTSTSLVVVDHGVAIGFSFEDLMKYHGPRAPGGVAHAFKVLERALPLLEAEAPPERRGIAIRTAFGGPGARDGFELVTRAVTDGRYVVDPALARPELGRTRERFVFELRYRERVVTLTLREGFVAEEFIALAFRDDRSTGEDRRLDVLKQEMADRLMSAPAHEVYDAEGDIPAHDPLTVARRFVAALNDDDVDVLRALSPDETRVARPDGVIVLLREATVEEHDGRVRLRIPARELRADDEVERVAEFEIRDGVVETFALR